MTRRELSALLSILVRQGKLTLAQARAILRRFDAGELSADALPLPLAIATAEPADERRNALLAVALLLGAFWARRMLGGQSVPLFRRQRVRDTLRAGFDQQAAQLAAALERNGNVAAWHGAMSEAVRQNVMRQYVAGSGGPITVAAMAVLTPVIREQLVFLYRFAGTVAVRSALGAPMSAAQVASRSIGYGGAAWSAFWRGMEAAEGETPGVVIMFRARDDGNTCGNCHNAAAGSPYLPGSNYPRPGSICLGGGRCRCSLEFVRDVAAWERLSGRRAA